jgi:retron-type reverse transcriptase
MSVTIQLNTTSCRATARQLGIVAMRESCVTRKCHAQFGERDRETRLVQTEKVRPVPTPPSPTLANLVLDGLEDELREHFPKVKTGNSAKVNLSRYADDVRRR